jgi:hypothetical protein
MSLQRIMQKAVCLCFALSVLLLIPQQAEQAGKPPASSINISSVDDLEIAYIVCDKAFLTVGRPAQWSVALSGDGDGYAYSFTLFFKPPQTNGDYFDGIKIQSFSDANRFVFTAENAGLYFVTASVRDGAGKTLELESEFFLAVSGRDWNERGTVAGTVKAVAAQCIRETDNTAYGRALWLHDWLIRHADYDDSFNEYYPDGVLLKGAGTCQSYAMAYQLLLHEAGVESIFVTGIADSDLHAWNLVKLFGLWYHVDVTWDDQDGTAPGYAYFGLPDTLMGRDHDWSGSNLYPACDRGEYDILERSGYLIFTDTNGLDACLHTALSEKKESFRLYYAGIDSRFDLAEQMNAWWDKKSDDYSVSELRWGASAWEGDVEAVYFTQ